MVQENKKVHFVGIKGVGMAALAILAKDMGYDVTGSDVVDSFVTDSELRQSGIPVLAFDTENLKDKPDFVVVSAAFGKDNVEVKEARKKHLEIKAYSEFLSLLTSNYQLIAVAGIHGKTTTTAIISYLLKKANLDPSFLIGAGNVVSLDNKSTHLGTGDYFVVEADEYRKSLESNDSKFYDLNPKIEIITSIEMDHPDLFLTDENVYEAFYKFAIKTPRLGFIVLCTDYPKAKKLLRTLVDRNFETYGFLEGARWQIQDYEENENTTSFKIKNIEKVYGPFSISLPGKGNVLNATAAIITTLKLQVEESLIKKYLPEFAGVKRRFEKIGQKGNLTIIDDYAHHPRSVKLTLEAARKKYPNRQILCIFQPHTFSRTKEFIEEFATSFNDADKVIVTSIYASAREERGTITGDDLAAKIRQNQKQVKYVDDFQVIINEVIDSLDKPTLLITMGAGDIYKIGNQILARVNGQ